MTDWTDIATTAANVVNLLAPVAEAAVPGATEAIAIGTKIVQGVMAAEPAAVALYEQIKSGTPPSPAQLQQFEADYEDAYQQLRSDIAEKLAALPPD